jgi:List-Bact-rpt repeat protein
MSKAKKNIQVFALILLTSALLIAAGSPNIASVKAQTQGTLIVFDSPGGTTSPTGTTTYPVGTNVTLIATPDTGFLFNYWEIVNPQGSYNVADNPYTLTISSASTFSVQASFVPIVYLSPATPSSPNLATVVVLAGVGGTTNPPPGTYGITDASQLNLMATADTGFTFSHWVIGGGPLTHGGYSFTDTPTNNPYNVGHGYGYTYTYQPVFNAISPATSPTPTPTVDEFSTVAAIVMALVLVAVAFGTYTFTKKTKK